MIKQRREAITQFQSGGRADLVARETAEISVLQGYLPAQMSEAEIEALIAEAIAATAAASIKDMGKVMAGARPPPHRPAHPGALPARANDGRGGCFPGRGPNFWAPAPQPHPPAQRRRAQR